MLSYSPYAGVTWQALHYLEGFHRLGFDVYYADDTGTCPVDGDGSVTNDENYFLEYIARIMKWWGHADHWVYRSGVDRREYSPSGQSLGDLLASADILINLTGSTVLTDEHLRVPVRIYLETDPFLPQIEVAQGVQQTIDLLAMHTHHFTFGENIGTPFCEVPVSLFTYAHTRQPVIIDWWRRADGNKSSTAGSSYTTVTSWKQTAKDTEWNGERFLWSKHEELAKFAALPMRSRYPFHAAITTDDAQAVRMLQDHGWTTSDALNLTSGDILPYLSFVQASRGEFTVAKDQYVRPNTGWFSDRSATYLASGRPVITQATGFDRILPTGRGLFGFRTMEEILAALEEIERDYASSCRAALEIANDYFAAEKVLKSMMERI